MIYRQSFSRWIKFLNTYSSSRSIVKLSIDFHKSWFCCALRFLYWKIRLTIESFTISTRYLISFERKLTTRDRSLLNRLKLRNQSKSLFFICWFVNLMSSNNDRSSWFNSNRFDRILLRFSTWNNDLRLIVNKNLSR